MSNFPGADGYIVSKKDLEYGMILDFDEKDYKFVDVNLKDDKICKNHMI